MGLVEGWAGVPALAGLIALSLVAVVAGLASLEVMSPTRDGYAVVASWLRRNSASNATVGSVEIGRIGLLSGRQMIDPLGLLDPAAVDHVRQQDWTWWLPHYRPDYVVVEAGLYWDPVTAWSTSPYFASTYRSVFSTGQLIVYERDDLVASSAS